MLETKVMNNDVSSCSRPTLAAYTKGEKQWELRVLHLRLFPGDNGSSHDKPKSGMRSIHVFVSSNNFGISFGRKEKRSKQLSVESTCFLAGNFVNHHLILAKLQGMLRLSMRQSVDADNESRAETSPCAIYLAFFLFFLRNNCKKHFFFRPSIVSLVANQITSRRVIFSEHFSGEEKLDDLVLHAHDFLSNIFSMPYMRKYSSNSW